MMTESASPTIRSETAPAGVVVRRYDAATEGAGPITALLHRAYRKQVELGLAPLAGRQDDELTLRRCTSSECYAAFLQVQGAPALVGVILLNEKEPAAFPEWFLRPEVAHFSQFAVDPEHQGHGIGLALLARVESRSLELGFSELSLSMAEPDEALRRFYEHRGYRFVQHWQWPYTNYRSLILSKSLPAGG